MSGSFEFYDFYKSRNSLPAGRFSLSKGGTTLGDSVKRGIDPEGEARQANCIKGILA